MEPGEAKPQRVFLFLQGPSSTLFARIAAELEERGHRCLRINLCTGDWVFWRRRGAINFRGRLSDWLAFVSAIMDREGVTDLILLGEERPHHRNATAAAKARGAPVFAVEMGYLRPDWIRIERDGSGYHSHFPANPAHILKAGSTLPPVDRTPKYTQSFLADAGLDLVFNLSNVFAWFFYPHYRWHAIYHPLAEYRGWIGRLMRGRARARDAARAVAKLLEDGNPFFVFPLQLETDYQIRSFSPFESQRDAMEMVLSSFKSSAGPETRLLVKLHPLDNGLIDWQKLIDAKASSHGLEGRVFFVDGGDLSDLLSRSDGVVTINSTVALEAIRLLKPTKVLGTAIYDIEGVTDQGALDRFWQAPRAPDAHLADAFLRLLAATIHVRGNFYSRAGVAAGAASIASRLHERSVNEPGGYVETPPRQRPVTGTP